MRTSLNKNLEELYTKKNINYFNLIFNFIEKLILILFCLNTCEKN